MNIRDYYTAVGYELDANYLPTDNRESLEKELLIVLTEDLPDYYNRNISVEMAALFIANKLRLCSSKVN